MLYFCPYCLCDFQYHSSLKRHVEVKHWNSIRYACEDCQISFRKFTCLQHHRDSIHAGNLPFTAFHSSLALNVEPARRHDSFLRLLLLCRYSGHLKLLIRGHLETGRVPDVTSGWMTGEGLVCQQCFASQCLRIFIPEGVARFTIEDMESQIHGGDYEGVVDRREFILQCLRRLQVLRAGSRRNT
ncbi:gonadotropin inducible transcription factor [Echinococcus multilocularis]|uniref:Gonadotropin inducible transcription factor n=1 Tax=Echinococcus multilocularis TaxID=6211 RepID=A0A068Y4Z5_ECHMU|nr:gonadotropin inducible transcription factor [Echinococcus multilocularis]